MRLFETFTYHVLKTVLYLIRFGFWEKFSGC